MENHAVVVALLRQKDKVVHRGRRTRCVQGHHKWSKVSGDCGEIGLRFVDGHRRGGGPGEIVDGGLG